MSISLDFFCPRLLIWAQRDVLSARFAQMLRVSSASRLQLQELVPPFELPSSGGEKVRLWDYKMRKNLVILFHHGDRCPQCRARLKLFSERYEEFLRCEVLDWLKSVQMQCLECPQV